MFTSVNLELQRDEPMVQLLDEKLNGFLKAILMRFVKPTTLLTSAELKKCNYKDPDSQRPDADLIVGHDVRDFIASHNLTSSQLDVFYRAVKKLLYCSV